MTEPPYKPPPAPSITRPVLLADLSRILAAMLDAFRSHGLAGEMSHPFAPEA